MTGRPRAAAICLTTADWYDRPTAVARLVRAIPHTLAAARIECGIYAEGSFTSETPAQSAFANLESAAECVCEKYAEIQGFFEAGNGPWPANDTHPLIRPLEQYLKARVDYARAACCLASSDDAAFIDGVVHGFIVGTGHRLPLSCGAVAILLELPT